MISGKSFNYIGQNFTIENNIIKGIEKSLDVQDTYNIGEIILSIFNNEPNHVAQIDVETGKQTTFKEMREKSLHCASWLEKEGVKNNDVIVICTHNHLDAYIPCIATFLVGAIYNPWHHEVPLKTARHFMSLTRPKIIFSSESAVKVLKEAARLENVKPKIILFENNSDCKCLEDVLRNHKSSRDITKFQPRRTLNHESVAMILFSSGTTGLPKGVAHSYKSLYRNIISFTVIPNKYYVALWYSSLYWISGTFCMLQSIVNYATRIVHANFEPEQTCKVIEQHKVNWLFIPPTMITNLCKSNVLKKYELKSLKSLCIAGAKLSSVIIKALKFSLPNVNIVQGYGMTELGGLASIQTDKCESIDSVGFIQPNARIKIVDVESNKILGPNQPGELYFKSPTIMLGYYNNPTATEEIIDKEGWLHTGDKAYYDENGEIYIIDRLKEVMKFRGHQISSFEIEQVLLGHPAVMEAVVVPVPHELDIERPMGFVRIVSGAKVTEDELVELSSTLGDFKKLWGGVKFLEKIPYTVTGKINRKELKDLAKTYVK